MGFYPLVWILSFVGGKNHCTRTILQVVQTSFLQMGCGKERKDNGQGAKGLYSVAMDTLKKGGLWSHFETSDLRC